MTNSPAPPVLTWSRPKVRKHKDLGRRKIWLANRGGYQVHKLLDYVLPMAFTASVPDRATLDHYKTLRAAQRACEQHHKAARGGRAPSPEVRR